MLLERLADSAMSHPGADRVRKVAGLARRSARSRAGELLAEGPQNVREALLARAEGRAAAQRVPLLRQLFVTAQGLERHPDIAALIEQALDRDDADLPQLTVRLAEQPVLAAMSDAQHPQGMLGICTIPQPADPAQLLREARLVAVLCRVQDPGNVGTILRAADAAGADAVVLTAGSADLHAPKTVRSTAGSLFHLPALTGADPAAVLAAAPQLQVLAADGRAHADLDALQDAAAGLSAVPVPSAVQDHGIHLARPTAWLLGNEAQGLSDSERQLAAAAVAVPLHGRAESLNVGMAAALCLYASARAQRRAG